MDEKTILRFNAIKKDLDYYKSNDLDFIWSNETVSWLVNQLETLESYILERKSNMKDLYGKGIKKVRDLDLYEVGIYNDQYVIGQRFDQHLDPDTEVAIVLTAEENAKGKYNVFKQLLDSNSYIKVSARTHILEEMFKNPYNVLLSYQTEFLERTLVTVYDIVEPFLAPDRKTVSFSVMGHVTIY